MSDERSNLLTFIVQYLLLLSFDFYTHSVCNASPWIGKNVQLAGKDEFPFVVSFSRKIHFGLEENHFCTGSLISKVHVLTAAHCIEDETKLFNIVVSVGSNKVGSGDRYEISAWMTYEKWAKQECVVCAYGVNDLIVVTLDEEVTDVKPGVISFTKDKDNYGKEAISVGWGRGNDGKIQKYLKKVYLKILSMKECEDELRNVYGEDLEVPWSYLCTVGRDSLTTFGDGDSGGPLIDVKTKKIIGVNESKCTKDETKDCHGVNLHVSVDYYRHFIKNYIPNCSSKHKPTKNSKTSIKLIS